MVCLGNICRSPMAEGILRSKIEAHGLSVEVDSAATSDYHIGDTPDPRSVQKCLDYNIDIRQLRGRQLQKEDFKIFDRIFVMDRSNFENAKQLTDDPTELAKLDLLLNLSSPGENKEVPDPYFGGEEGFEHVYHLLDEACEQLIAQLKDE